MSEFKIRLIRISFGAYTDWTTKDITFKEWIFLMKCLKNYRKKKKVKKKNERRKDGKLLDF